MFPKEYLGDSVYCEIESGMLKLTTDNGIGPTNTIYLELEVFAALVSYKERAVQYYESEQAKAT